MARPRLSLQGQGLTAAESSRSVVGSGMAKRSGLLKQRWGLKQIIASTGAFVSALRGKCREFLTRALRTHLAGTLGLLSDLREFVKGDFTYEEISGRYHDDCRTIHESGKCPRLLAAFCPRCNRHQELNEHGNCPDCGNVAVVGRRSAYV